MSGPAGRPAPRHVVLVGMPGAGKTSTGRALAALIGRGFVDTDETVERTSGMSVAELFRRHGEEAFRAAEHDALADALGASPPRVVAAGGGAVLAPANRALFEGSDVVWLRADTDTLAARLGAAGDRPLLAGDPAGALARLDAERAPLYAAVATVVVDVDGLSADQAALRAVGALQRRVRVGLAGRGYDVVVGPGAARLLAEVLPRGARRCCLVTQEGIPVAVETGLETTRLEIGRGERAKSVATLEALWRRFVAAGLTRADVVVALGGGMVSDVAGFAAATYHRGVRVVHVATTLLAQVDAAIGGKTGINLPEGKNLVGAFWQPSAVLCDTDVLLSLPGREWRSGLGEMAKYAFLGVEDLDDLPLVEQVARCVAAKAAVVAADEREAGARARLNYGHTLAHALEAVGLAGDEGDPGALDLRHGEAVAIGLVFAARLAERLGRIGPERVARHLEVVRGYGLPDTLPAAAEDDALVAAMARDKKATAGLTFVLDGPRGVEPVAGVDPAVVSEVLATWRKEAP